MSLSTARPLVTAIKQATLQEDRLTFATTPSGRIPRLHIKNCHYFTVDGDYHYQSFCQDFGPYNEAVLYKFCHKMNGIFTNPALIGKHIVLYTSSRNRQRQSNVAFLVGAYCVLYLQMDPSTVRDKMSACGPYAPFRDASTSPMSFGITIVDCFYAIKEAARWRWLDFQNFDVEEYEKYEMVENGDFNWIVPDRMLAFCGPHSRAVSASEGYPTHTPESYHSYFRQHNVTTIIRTNQRQYDERRFTNAGFEFHDLFFIDGTTPTKSIVKKFLSICDDAFTRGGGVAIHCKAGLGRTGTLIACYLMKEYMLPAEVIIAWLRICRPGSVLGQQQHYLKTVEPWLFKLGIEEREAQNQEMAAISGKVDTISLDDQSDPPLLSTQSPAKSSTSMDAWAVEPAPVREEAVQSGWDGSLPGIPSPRQRAPESIFLNMDHVNGGTLSDLSYRPDSPNLPSIATMPLSYRTHATPPLRHRASFSRSTTPTVSNGSDSSSGSIGNTVSLLSPTTPSSPPTSISLMPSSVPDDSVFARTSPMTPMDYDLYPPDLGVSEVQQSPSQGDFLRRAKTKSQHSSSTSQKSTPMPKIGDNSTITQTMPRIGLGTMVQQSPKDSTPSSRLPLARTSVSTMLDQLIIGGKRPPSTDEPPLSSVKRNRGDSDLDTPRVVNRPARGTFTSTGASSSTIPTTSIVESSSIPSPCNGTREPLHSSSSDCSRDGSATDPFELTLSPPLFPQSPQLITGDKREGKYPLRQSKVGKGLAKLRRSGKRNLA